MSKLLITTLTEKLDRFQVDKFYTYCQNLSSSGVDIQLLVDSPEGRPILVKYLVYMIEFNRFYKKLEEEAYQQWDNQKNIRSYIIRLKQQLTNLHDMQQKEVFESMVIDRINKQGIEAGGKIEGYVVEDTGEYKERIIAKPGIGLIPSQDVYFYFDLFNIILKRFIHLLEFHISEFEKSDFIKPDDIILKEITKVQELVAELKESKKSSPEELIIDTLVIKGHNSPGFGARIHSCLEILKPTFINNEVTPAIFLGLFAKNQFTNQVRWCGNNQELNYFICGISGKLFIEIQQPKNKKIKKSTPEKIGENILINSNNPWVQAANCFFKFEKGDLTNTKITKHKSSNKIVPDRKKTLLNAIKALH